MPSSGQRDAASCATRLISVFRHAGIMLDFERRERAPFVTAKPGEGDNRADIAAPICQNGGFGSGVKAVFLDAHDDPGAQNIIPRSSAGKTQSPAHS